MSDHCERFTPLYMAKVDWVCPECEEGVMRVFGVRDTLTDKVVHSCTRCHHKEESKAYYPRIILRDPDGNEVNPDNL